MPLNDAAATRRKPFDKNTIASREEKKSFRKATTTKKEARENVGMSVSKCFLRRVATLMDFLVG